MLKLNIQINLLEILYNLCLYKNYNVIISKLFPLYISLITDARMGHLAEKFYTTYIKNLFNIFYKIALTFSNIMTLNISVNLHSWLMRVQGFLSKL